MKRFVAATLCSTAFAAICFSATAGDMPCFEAPEFVAPVFEQAVFQQAEFVQPEFVEATFVQTEFHQTEFVQAEFVQPEFVSPEFDSQCSSSRARSYGGSGRGNLMFSRGLISQKSSSRPESTVTVRSLARFNGDYVAKSLQTPRYHYLLDSAIAKKAAVPAILTQPAPADDCPCHARKAQAAANQPRLAIR